MSLLVLVYIVLLIILNVRNAGKQKYTTVYMRILTNYFQILTLTQSFNLSWDDNLKQFLQAISFIAESSSIILSVDCFIRNKGVSMHPAFAKLIVACVFPLAMIIGIIVVWLLFKLCCKKWQIKRNIIISIIVLIFIALPPISTITMSIYNCVDIFADGNSFLAVDMSIKCWEGEQSKYAKRFGVPVIIIWIVGFPVFALILLFKNRKRLQNEQF